MMNNLNRCHVSYQIDQYLNVLDDEESFQDELEEFAERLMQGDYSPYIPDNFNEAIGEIDIEDLASLLKKGNVELFGELIDKRVCAYWKKQALVVAEAELMKNHNQD